MKWVSGIHNGCEVNFLKLKPTHVVLLEGIILIYIYYLLLLLLLLFIKVTNLLEKGTPRTSKHLKVFFNEIWHPWSMKNLKHEGNNIFEGYMFLHNRSFFRQWMFKPKYFILTPHYIYCFKTSWRSRFHSTRCHSIATSFSVDWRRS